MFAINHAATALVLKRRYPTVRMAFILLAVQAVELLWVALNVLGIEVTTTDDTVRSVQNIHLLHMPWSHSIATTLVFAIVAWTLIRFALGKPKTAIAVALGIASHLVLDLATHSPDIAVAPGLGSRAKSKTKKGWSRSSTPSRDLTSRRMSVHVRLLSRWRRQPRSATS